MSCQTSSSKQWNTIIRKYNKFILNNDKYKIINNNIATIILRLVQKLNSNYKQVYMMS